MAATRCSDLVEGRIATSTAFESWRATTDAALTQLAAGTTTPVALTTLSEKEADILQTNLCLQQKLRGLGTATDAISSRQQEILDLEQRIQNQTQLVEISKDRVRYTRKAERPVSFYESWFPVGRPLRPITIPILFGISLFFGVFFLLITFSSMGYIFSLKVPDSPFFDMIVAYFSQLGLTTPFWIVLAVLIGFVIYYFRTRG